MVATDLLRYLAAARLSVASQAIKTSAIQASTGWIGFRYCSPFCFSFALSAVTVLLGDLDCFFSGESILPEDSSGADGE